MRFEIPVHKKPSAAGQAATEYLLLVAMVLILFTGMTALFSKQIQNYLDLLFEMICLPF
jgi:hypothetical protein